MTSRKWPVALGLTLLACADKPRRDEAPPPQSSPWDRRCEGPIAANAAEAWPSHPGDLPRLTIPAIERACDAYLACVPSNLDAPFASRADCSFLVGVAAHVAAPIRDMSLTGNATTNYQERAEFFVSCVHSASDCAEVSQCLTPDGGDGYSKRHDVTCAGSIATYTDGSNRYERDCSRAYAECDPTSVTGCTDRPRSCCPTGRRATRCDGSVLLECGDDGALIYWDCSRLSATCDVSNSAGGSGCIY